LLGYFEWDIFICFRKQGLCFFGRANPVFCCFFAADLKDTMKFNCKKQQLPPGFISNGFRPFVGLLFPMKYRFG